jgi:fatty acid desaturase
MNLQELDKAVYSAGYMKRTYWYYSFLSLFIFSGLILSIVVFILSNALWLQAITLVVFTFFRMQIGFLSHDFSHNQVFKSKTKNKIFAYFLWGLVL